MCGDLLNSVVWSRYPHCTHSKCHRSQDCLSSENCINQCFHLQCLAPFQAYAVVNYRAFPELSPTPTSFVCFAISNTCFENHYLRQRFSRGTTEIRALIFLYSSTDTAKLVQPVETKCPNQRFGHTYNILSMRQVILFYPLHLKRFLPDFPQRVFLQLQLLLLLQEQ